MSPISPRKDDAGQKPEPRLHIPQSTFDRLLLESIDEVLSDLFGERTRDLIYDHIATHHNYGREELPERMDEFYSFLEHVFSRSGRTISRTIIRRLYAKLNYEYVNVPGLQFIDYLEILNARVARDVGSRDRVKDVMWVHA